MGAYEKFQQRQYIFDSVIHPAAVIASDVEIGIRRSGYGGSDNPIGQAALDRTRSSTPAHVSTTTAGLVRTCI